MAWKLTSLLNKLLIKNFWNIILLMFQNKKIFHYNILSHRRIAREKHGLNQLVKIILD